MARYLWLAVGMLVGQACSDAASPGSGQVVGDQPASSSMPGLGSFVCPSPPYAATPIQPEATAELIAGVPPDDDFVSGGASIILEGPVWHEGKLYLSEINGGAPLGGGLGAPNPDAPNVGTREPPPSRVLSVTEDGVVEIALADSGSNGLAIDGQGALVACNHETGAVTRLALSGQAPSDLVASYAGARFNSPNDLTFGADGTLYFTDPDYQAPSPTPQAATRAYRVPPGTTTALPIVETRREPNGITLSPERTTLYVSAADGVMAYPVLADGSLGTGETFAEGVVRSSDGMAVDCAGNLYTTAGSEVTVVSPTGALVARIAVPGVQSVTNVAFGGEGRQTLYITTLGSGGRVGLFALRSAIAGMPY